MEFAKYSLIFKSEHNGSLLINTMTNSIVRFDFDHTVRLMNYLKGSEDREVGAFLFKKHFLRDDTFVQKFLDDKYKALFCSKDFFDICIFTSLRCNLRCPYCYERHDGPTMEAGIYDELQRKIQKASPKALFISWFGGEPLLNKQEVIGFSRKMKKLQESSGHIFMAGITTNGTLLDEETAKALIDSHVISFQVTVDGPKETNDLSRIKADGTGTFDQIIENLDAMKSLKGNFSVIVRCNVKDKFILDPFCDLFERHFANDERFSLLFYPVSDWKNIGKECMTKSFNIFALNQIVLDRGLHSALMDSVNNEGFFCQFGYPGKFVVFPDGTIGNCTIKMDKKAELKDCPFPRFENEKPCEMEDCLLYPKCFGRRCRYGERGSKSCENMLEGVLKFYKHFAETILHEEVSILV